MSPRTALVVLLSLSATLVVACGGGGQTPAPAPSGPAPSAPVSSPAPPQPVEPEEPAPGVHPSPAPLAPTAWDAKGGEEVHGVVEGVFSEQKAVTVRRVVGGPLATFRVGSKTKASLHGATFTDWSRASPGMGVYADVDPPTGVASRVFLFRDTDAKGFRIGLSPTQAELIPAMNAARVDAVKARERWEAECAARAETVAAWERRCLERLEAAKRRQDEARQEAERAAEDRGRVPPTAEAGQRHGPPRLRQQLRGPATTSARRPSFSAAARSRSTSTVTREKTEPAFASICGLRLALGRPHGGGRPNGWIDAAVEHERAEAGQVPLPRPVDAVGRAQAGVEPLRRTRRRVPARR